VSWSLMSCDWEISLVEKGGIHLLGDELKENAVSTRSSNDTTSRPRQVSGG